MTDIELLPLPKWLLEAFTDPTIERLRDYTRANVAHATAAKDAEIEALRAEVEAWKASHSLLTDTCHHFQARAKRLTEALREVESELGPEVPLNHDSGNAVHRALSAAMAALNQEGKDG